MAWSIIDWLTASATRRPAHPAVEEASGSTVSYAELNDLSDRVRDRLRAQGVGKGDRVGIYLRKSIDAYAAMLGALKAGAVYVPIDHASPFWRSAFTTSDCLVKALVVDRALTPAWSAEAERLGPVPALLELGEGGGGRGLRAALDRAEAAQPAPRTANVPVGGDDLAYILYTSGSTGTPKGVMLTHTCATSHVDWYSSVFAPTEADRFSSHAPFHFDLSITDLFVPLKHGATVVLIDADQGKEPLGLAKLIADRRVTIWYSTPTVLTMLAEFGRLQLHDISALRYVLFAGEVFPPKHLRAVKARAPRARFFNLYGPTETNVCTWHPIPDVVEEGRLEPYPIGRTCSHFLSRVVDGSGRDVDHGTEGELVIHGDGMLKGYFNDPERTAGAFLVDAEGGVRITAYLAFEPGQGRSEIQMRAYCARTLPGYMMPDAFRFLDALPKTSTDKIDYQRLMKVD